MRNLLLILFIFLYSLEINNVYSQDNREELYLEVLEFILSKQLFNINEMEIIYENDTCFFYSRSENFVGNTEKRFEFIYDTHFIKVWPSDHVFFFDIKNYAQIKDCQILNNEAILNLELYVDRKSIKKLKINLKKKDKYWKVRKIKKVN